MKWGVIMSIEILVKCSAPLKAIFFALSCLALLPSPAHGSDGRKATCEFSRSLDKPFNRIQFLHRLSKIRKEASDTLGGPERMYRSVVKVSLSSHEEAEIDELTLQCLNCHDGVYATGHLIRMRNGAARGAGSIDHIHGGHPIGMDYGKLAFRGRNLKRPDQLPPEIVLASGKVGCLSCHNPANPEGHHMTVAMEHSTLCFSCHIK